MCNFTDTIMVAAPAILMSCLWVAVPHDAFLGTYWSDVRFTYRILFYHLAWNCWMRFTAIGTQFTSEKCLSSWRGFELSSYRWVDWQSIQCCFCCMLPCFLLINSSYQCIKLPLFINDLPTDCQAHILGQLIMINSWPYIDDGTPRVCSGQILDSTLSKRR